MIICNPRFYAALFTTIIKQRKKDILDIEKIKKYNPVNVCVEIRMSLFFQSACMSIYIYIYIYIYVCVCVCLCARVYINFEQEKLRGHQPIKEGNLWITTAKTLHAGALKTHLSLEIPKRQKKMPSLRSKTKMPRYAKIHHRSNSSSERSLLILIPPRHLHVCKLHHHPVVPPARIPNPLSPLLPIIHRFWQVFRVTSRILT